MMMSLRVTGRNKIIVDTSVNPIYRKMLQSYTTNLHIELIETTSSDGLANRETLFDLIDKFLCISKTPSEFDQS